METRADLIEYIRESLQKQGFSVTGEHFLGSSIFDIAAKRDDLVYLIKVLFNVDSLKANISLDMRVLAKPLEALPLLIGKVCNSGPLEDEVVYMRHSISTMTERTFLEYASEESLPLIYAAPGGFYARMDGRILKKLREERNISISTLAGVARVSRKAITLYESEVMGANIDVVTRIEAFLDAPLTLPVDLEDLLGDDVVRERVMHNTKIFEILRELGYNVSTFKRSPIDAVVSREEHVISQIGGGNMKWRLEALIELSEVIDEAGVVFVKKSNKDNYKSISIISEEELWDHGDDLFRIIEKKKKR